MEMDCGVLYIMKQKALDCGYTEYQVKPDNTECDNVL